uniref:Odorant receptor n=1 Tax=Grapholita molesta TaxID=192188 RepID=A0A9Y1IQD5_GRAMO|nr:odorant-receptor-14 [Grapholita molesta]
MKQLIITILSRYIPVWHHQNPAIATVVQRVIWNTGVWHHQSLRLHWFAKFTIVCFLSTSITQIVTLVIERHDSTRMFETFSVLSFCFMGTLKLFNLYTNRKRWIFIISQVKLLEEEQLHGKRYHCDFDIEEDYVEEMIVTYTKKNTFLTSILLKIYSMTAVIFIATPILEYVVTADARYPHILPCWVPLEHVGFIGYVVTIILEAVAAIYCVVVHTAFDCASVGIMIFISGQFALLRRRTEDIAGRGKYYMPSTNRDARAHLRIIQSYSTHNALCSVIKELDFSLRGILGVYFLISTLTVCSVAVRLSTETLSFMQLVSLLQYMCGILTQLFLFCRYGDAVFHESSFNMGEGPFGAAWWALQPRVRRELAMLGAGMVHPRSLHAGPFNKLDLPTFVQIVRAAYSSYAVLGQTSK